MEFDKETDTKFKTNLTMQALSEIARAFRNLDLVKELLNSRNGQLQQETITNLQSESKLIIDKANGLLDISDALSPDEDGMIPED